MKTKIIYSLKNKNKFVKNELFTVTCIFSCNLTSNLTSEILTIDQLCILTNNLTKHWLDLLQNKIQSWIFQQLNQHIYIKQCTSI